MDAGWVIIICSMLVVIIIIPEILIVIVCSSPLWLSLVLLSIDPQINKNMDDVTNYRCSPEQLLLVEIEAKSCLTSGGSMCFEQAKKSLCTRLIKEDSADEEIEVILR